MRHAFMRRLAAVFVVPLLAALAPLPTPLSGAQIAFAAPSATANLTCVTFPTTTVGYAAGSGGTILKSVDGGASWSAPQSVPTSLWTKTITGIAFWDSTHGVVVTSDRATYGTNDGGTTWASRNDDMTLYNSGGPIRLNAVAAVPGTAYRGVLAAGDASPGDADPLAPQLWANERTNPGDYWGGEPRFQVLHSYRGDPDNTLYDEGLGDFIGLDLVSGALGWAVGVDTWTGTDVNGVVKSEPEAIAAQTTDGGYTWQKQTLPASSATLRAVSFADANFGVIVGSGGSVFHTASGGGTWSTGGSGTTSGLNGVVMSSTTQGWAVGDSGVVLATSDGGATWAPVISRTTADLNAIARVTGTTTVAVGDGGVIRRLVNGTLPPNAAPVLAAIGNKSVDELAELSFTALATDADGDPLTFSLGAGAPSGAAITPAGAFTWTPNEAQGPGTYDATIVVSDGQGGTDSETITIEVNEVNAAPVLGAIGNKSVDELAELSFTALATDADGDPLTFSLGAGAPSGAAITPAGGFTWTPTEAQGPGAYDVTVVVSDGQATDSETITINVTLPTTLGGISGTKTTGYDTALTIYADLKAGTTPLPAKDVFLETSTNGATGWTRAAATITQPIPGRYQTSVRRKTTLYYRFKFAGDATYGSKAGGVIKVYPMARLTRSTSWTTLYRYKTYYAIGYVEPAHSSTSGKITIRAYKRASNGLYYYKKSFTASYAYYNSTKTRYKAAVRFSTYDKGTWKLIALHAADSSNAQTYGSTDYVTVR